MRVLIVDDDPDCRQILELMLAKQGWALSFAENGREGLDKALAMQPDLILMDVLMPVMTGLDAVRAMKIHPLLRHTAVFAITALAFEQECHAAYAAGYDLVLTKPFGRRQLLEAIARQFPEIPALITRVSA